VRYADDFLILVAGDRTDAERLREETARVLLPMGLRLSEEKTVIVHIDEGFDFLGMHIQRHKKLGAAKRYVYTYPSRAALASVKAKVRSATRGTTNQSLSELVSRLNPVLRGWTNYHRHGASSKTFSYLSAFTWRRVWIWLRHKHPNATVKELRRRYLPGWWPTQDEARLFKPDAVAIRRYRYRGAAIASPWATTQGVV
jgi:RNA-directed DNA polymerase